MLLTCAYPDPSFYGADTQSAAERQELLHWLETRRGHVFNFREEMHK